MRKSLLQSGQQAGDTPLSVRSAKIGSSVMSNVKKKEELPAKKKKPVKYCKAPQAPKRFKSAFIFFTMARHHEIRKKLEGEGGGDKTPDVAKLVSEEWRNQTPEERAVWDEKARLDKERYEIEKAMYTGPWKVPVKKKRSSKDSEAPKRPMSSFLSFSNEKRSGLKKSNPFLSNKEATRLLAQMWRDAPEDEKRVHIEREAALREQYKVDIAAWREKVKREETMKREQSENMARAIMANRRGAFGGMGGESSFPHESFDMQAYAYPQNNPSSSEVAAYPSETHDRSAMGHSYAAPYPYPHGEGGYSSTSSSYGWGSSQPPPFHQPPSGYYSGTRDHPQPYPDHGMKGEQSSTPYGHPAQPTYGTATPPYGYPPPPPPPYSGAEGGWHGPTDQSWGYQTNPAGGYPNSAPPQSSYAGYPSYGQHPQSQHPQSQHPQSQHPQSQHPQSQHQIDYGGSSSEPTPAAYDTRSDPFQPDDVHCYSGPQHTPQDDDRQGVGESQSEFVKDNEWSTSGSGRFGRDGGGSPSR